jgi:hypothetical protein
MTQVQQMYADSNDGFLLRVSGGRADQAATGVLQPTRVCHTVVSV